MEIIPLHLGLAYFSAPKVAVQALQKVLANGQTYYGPTEGTQELRETVVQRYQEDEGITIPIEQVLITHGTKHALYLYLKSLLHPGDEVVMLAPYWMAFPDLVRQSGGKLTTVEANPEEEYALPIEKLSKAITQETRLLLISNPGNPTGKVYTPQELSALADLLQQYPNLHLLSDEIYDGLVYETPTHSFLRFQDLADRVAVVNGFSKSFAMSGWRVGYLIAPPLILQRAVELQNELISGVSPLTQTGAAAALQNRHSIFQEFKAALLPRREQTIQMLAQFPKLSYFIPQGGYYVNLNIRGYLQEQDRASPYKLAEEWAAALKDQVGLEVLTSTKMGTHGMVRINFALPQDLLNEALRRLSVFLS